MPDLRDKYAYIKIYDIIWLSSFHLFKNTDFEQNSWFFGPKSRTHFGHFLQIFKKGSPQKILKKFSAKMPDLREKCAYIKIHDIIWSSYFLLFKNADFEQNSWFFGPKSRSSIGVFPHKCREFITEISKGIEAFEWIWVKIVKSLLFLWFLMKYQRYDYYDHISVKWMNFWILIFVPYTSRCVALDGRERREHRRRK